MEDPWFTYERGRGRHRLSPRNGKGWAAFLAFLAALLVPSLAIPFLKLPPLLLLAILPIMLMTIFLFVRWARGRAEIYEPVSSAELAEFREWKRQQGRR